MRCRCNPSPRLHPSLLPPSNVPQKHYIWYLPPASTAQRTTSQSLQTPPSKWGEWSHRPCFRTLTTKLPQLASPTCFTCHILQSVPSTVAAASLRPQFRSNPIAKLCLNWIFVLISMPPATHRMIQTLPSAQPTYHPLHPTSPEFVPRVIWQNHRKSRSRAAMVIVSKIPWIRSHATAPLRDSSAAPFNVELRPCLDRRLHV